MTKRLMTPGDPRWGEFCERMLALSGCDNTTRQASLILDELGCDITSSLAGFRQCCDCEIRLNVILKEESC